MQLFQLITNPYTFTFLIAVLSNLFLIIYILKRGYNSLTVLMFLFYLSGTLIMGTGQMMASASTDEISFEFWNAIFYFGILFYPATYLAFTMSFLGKEKILRNFLFWVFIIAPTIILIFLSLYIPNLITVNDFDKTKLYPWGHQVFANGKFSPLILIWYQVCFLTSIFLLVKFYRKNRDLVIKKQVKLLMIAITIPFIGGALTQGLLPQFGIRIFPIGVPLNTVNMMIIAYAILKYGLTVIDPGAIAASVTKIMPSSVIVLDDKDKIIVVNSFTEKYLGFKEEELIGQNITKIFPEKNQLDEFYLKIIEPLKNNNTVNAVEGLLTTSTNHKKVVNIYAANYQDKINGFDAKVLVFSDIQRLKILQEELEIEKHSVEKKVDERTIELKEEQVKLRASINSLSVGFIIIDKISDSILLNEAVRKIFMLPIISTNSSLLELKQIADDLKNVINVDEEINKCMNLQKPIIFKEIPFKDNFYRVIFTPTIISHQNQKRVTGCAILIDDITEDRIVARSREEFFTLASHELRTPLTAIRGYSVMIGQTFPEIIEKNPIIQKMLGTINDSSIRLINIVNEFIDSSTLEQGKMMFRKDKINISEIILEVFEDFKITTEQKKVYLNLEDEAQKIIVLADKNHLKQVLTNLINNALKFTDQGGVTLIVKKEGAFAKIFIADTGKGIAPNLQNLLFRKFQQAVKDIYTRDGMQQGTGLGLYICRLMVEGMGGQIELERSAVAQGSVFSFTLPLAK